MEKGKFLTLKHGHSKDEKKWEPTDGYIVYNEPFYYGLYKYKYGNLTLWNVTELNSGLKVQDGFRSRAEAKDFAEGKTINGLIKKYAASNKEHYAKTADVYQTRQDDGELTRTYKLIKDVYTYVENSLFLEGKKGKWIE